jgi:diacylglycerol kinase (ATP)
MAAPRKSGSGFARAWAATRYSLDGLAACARNEAAFRELVVLLIAGSAAALWLTPVALERAVLIGSLFVPLVVEMLNAAIEATVDRISLERHPLAKRAKDIGSAAVMVALVGTGVVWVLVLA